MLYSFKNISISSKAELNNYISDEQILTFYFKEFELNTHYLSPFHPEKNPSFIISYFNDQLRWRDFGISNRPSDVIDFVSKLFNIGFIDSLNKIYNDIVIGNKIPTVKEYKKPNTLEYSLTYRRTWEDWQLDFWLKGNIKKSTLDLFRVYWCKELWFNNRLFARGSKYNLMYYYDHSTIDLKESWTVYRPNRTDSKKFRKHNITNQIMGLDLIPDTGDILMITKSYKDMMIFYELGLPSIAPHSENTPIDENIINDLKSRFDRIYVNYDNDTVGVNSSIEFTRKYDLNYWNLPKSTNCKDPFQCSTVMGLDKLFDLISHKIKI